MRASDEISALDRARAGYEPGLPAILDGEAGRLGFEEGPATRAVADEQAIRERFPRSFGRPLLRLAPRARAVEPRPLVVGIVLSGGQAPGGHNVISGTFDGIRAIHHTSRLIGFRGGPRGILAGDHVELDAATLRPFRNSGGFDLLGSGRDKIETDEQLAAARGACRQLGLDGLVVVGGDDSNTNAAVLAEHLLAAGERIAVVGVPKTIDGDMKGGPVEASFGFDTATRVYSELIGNICRDARSAAKYWHFVKLMGRSASHVTLECALATRPNLALIAEEIRRRERTLEQLVEQVAAGVRRRAAAGRHYGVCLIPEGLIEFVPEMQALIAELNRIVSSEKDLERAESVDERGDLVASRLSRPAARTFAGLPAAIRRQLLLDRDAHGNVQVSKIDTEQLLIAQVGERVREWQAAGEFPGRFAVQGHFFGYEGRCAAPTNFDACYTYALGRTAALLVAAGRTGYLGAVGNLVAAPSAWEPLGVPLTSMMRMETRKGRPTPVIGKALVDLDGAPFRSFAAARERWLDEDAYRYPGAIQYFGPPEIADRPTETLRLEAGG